MDFSSSEDLKVSATDTYREIGTHRQQRTRTITVDITNDTSKDVRGHRMRIPADKHFLSGVSEPIGLITAYGGTARMTVKTTSRPGASIDNLMGEFTINFRNEDDSRTVLSKTFTDMYLRAWDGLKVFNPDDPAAVAKFNILLFGWAGAGKSSLLQSIMTLLTESREVLKNAVTVGGGQDHVTTDIRYTDLNKFGIHANLVDTWGMDGDNYTGKTLSMLCQGLLPSGWGMYQAMGQDEAAKIARGAATREQRQIHAVLFCLPHAMIESEADMANIAGQFQELVRQGINPIVLLSRIDEVVPEVRDDPLGTHDGVEMLRVAVAKRLMIPMSRVLPMVPYVDENQRDFDKDRLLFKTLSMALRHASEFRTLGDIDRGIKELDFDVGGGVHHGRVHATSVGKGGAGADGGGGTAQVVAPVVDAANAKLLEAMGIVKGFTVAPAVPPPPPSSALTKIRPAALGTPPPPSSAPAETRLAPDGCLYQRHDFLAFFGSLKHWDAASSTSSLPPPPPRSPLLQATQPRARNKAGRRTRQAACRNGVQCARQDCHFVHPAGWKGGQAPMTPKGPTNPPPPPPPASIRGAVGGGGGGERPPPIPFARVVHSTAFNPEKGDFAVRKGERVRVVAIDRAGVPPWAYTVALPNGREVGTELSMLTPPVDGTPPKGGVPTAFRQVGRGGSRGLFSSVRSFFGGGGGEVRDTPPPPPADLPRGWTQYADGKRGRSYYVHVATGVTQWDKP